MSKLSERIKKLRKEKKISQAELAKEIEAGSIVFPIGNLEDVNLILIFL